ncbi:MAG: carboxypeptidase-like regulatory domain-containing protein [Planctomycetaceae bacterium]|jgi:hypothetical protein|nr:carboxypeptidase-like regulatory domain-containing protein [Planctomycetaceae bacterium]
MKHFTAITLLSLLLAATGCGESSPYKVIFVSGTVTVDGAPMEGVNVIFSPVNPNEGHTAGGVTDAKGNFKLTTGGLKIGKGAVAGKYNVLFEKSTNEGIGLSDEEYDKRFLFLAPKIIYQIPRKYNSPSASGVEPVSVESGGKNAFTFALSSEGLDEDNVHLNKEPSKPGGSNRVKSKER